MLRKPVVLITGAGGEIGHGLIERLAGGDDRRIITLDVAPLEPSLARMVSLRNRIAHGYASVDVDRLWTELPVGLEALDAYATAVARSVPPVTGAGS